MPCQFEQNKYNLIQETQFFFFWERELKIHNILVINTNCINYVLFMSYMSSDWQSVQRSQFHHQFLWIAFDFTFFRTRTGEYQNVWQYSAKITWL